MTETDAVTALVEAARHDDPDAWHSLVDRYALRETAAVVGLSPGRGGGG